MHVLDMYDGLKTYYNIFYEFIARADICLFK